VNPNLLHKNTFVFTGFHSAINGSGNYEESGEGLSAMVAGIVAMTLHHCIDCLHVPCCYLQ